MIRKYYIDDDLAAGGGGGNPPAAPKGYAVTTPQQRSDWNGFLDYAGKQPGANLSDAKQQTALLAQYKKANPNFSITADQIPNIQYEAYQIRQGDKFGNLGAKELGYIRQGMNPNFLNADTANISKLYYPQLASHGTDIEGYYNSKFNPAAAKSVASPVLSATNGVASPGSPAPGTKPAATSPAVGPTPPGAIPPPNYDDPSSRLQYAHNWTQKYGPLMQGRGDTPLRVNDVPQFGTQTAKQMSMGAAGKLGIDPALLYTSAMEEGLSGNFPDRQGNYKYERSGQSDKFPVNSSSDFGLDQVRSEIKRFQEKGYLPADFQKHYANAKHDPGEMGSGGKPVTHNDVDLDSPESAMQLKAAYLKDNYESVSQSSQQKGISLSPRAKDFFALVAYNAGTGVADQMMRDYHKNGYLKNDAFMNGRPTKGEGLSEKSYGPTYDKNGKQTSDGVYTNVLRRVQMAEALKKEKLFE